MKKYIETNANMNSLIFLLSKLTPRGLPDHYTLKELTASVDDWDQWFARARRYEVSPA